MRIVVPLIVALALAGPVQAQMLGAQTVQSLPPGAEARQARLLAHMGPQARAFIQREARAEAASGGGSETRARGAAEANRAMLGAMRGGDIDALVFLILMEVNHEAEADLRQQIADMQQANARKAAIRQQHAAMSSAQAGASTDLAREYAALRAAGKISPSLTLGQFVANRQPPGPPVSFRVLAGIQDNSRGAPAMQTKAGLDSESGQIKGQLDSQSELGETGSLRLQMAMDRRSRFVETLSNLMKKIDNTNEAIVQNLK